MKPYLHGKVSAKKFGGKPEDYVDIHNFLDVSKSAHPDMRHRALLHNSLGCYIAERMFGTPESQLEALQERFGWSKEELSAVRDLLTSARTDGCTSIRNSDGKLVQVRDVAEQHIIDDMGRIPTVSDYLDGMPMYKWLGGPKTMKRYIPMTD